MIWTLALGLAWLALAASLFLGWQLLRQNGRILLRLQELEKRLDETEFGDHEEGAEPTNDSQSVGSGESKGENERLLTSSPTDNGEGRSNRFQNHSLARSKLKRDGLKAGTPAPDFRLPRLDGRGDLSLSELRGRHVLLVFSSPRCGPCNTLAPKVEEFHRAHSDIQVLVVSRGEPGENRAKVKEHRLTFPIVLQQQWEISRLYAMFATPVAYLIDETGVIAQDVAVGVDAILQLMQGIEDTPVSETAKSLPTEVPI